MIRERREPYKQNESVKYDNLKQFFKENKIEFNKDENKTAESIIKSIDAKKTYVSRVWLLFARNDNENWDCVQVAQSRKRVQDEIEDAIRNLFTNFVPFKKINIRIVSFIKTYVHLKRERNIIKIYIVK